MALLTIGAAAMPNPETPGGYSVMLYDMDSDQSGRGTETGILQRERIRAGTYKVSYKAKVTKTQLNAIMTAIAPASFSATFFDGSAASDTTKTMMVGDRTMTLLSYLNEAAPDDSEWSIAFNLIEY